MIYKSIQSVTLDTHISLSAALRGSQEPGDTSEEIAIRDLADLTAHGAIITRVRERDLQGAVHFDYLISVEQLLRYEAIWGDPLEPVTVSLWRQGYRGSSEADLLDIQQHLRTLWRERYGTELRDRVREEDFTLFLRTITRFTGN